jgi:hypothetical protein
MESAVYVPLSQRVNLRMIVFGAVMALLIGTPLYIYVDSAISGGIKDAGGGYLAVNLKHMSSFVFDQQNGTVNDVPQKWRELDGKKVILVGEMWNAQDAGNSLGSFELCYSIAKCCFSGPPQVQHFVQSTVPAGRTARYYNGPVKVRGTLRVNIVKDPQAGKVDSVYQLDVESVEPA